MLCMNGMGDLDRKNLVNVLTEGLELARQLQCHLNMQSSSPERRELLLQRILASYERAISMLNLSNSVNDQQQQLDQHGARMPESPPLSGSPGGEDSENGQDNNEPSRKRKAVAKWTKQVKISPGTGLEGPLDDGFSWRKYGQKDILGAKYPRGYYRCTYRNVQGCMAKKQVQRSDLDPTIFEVTYCGHHACSQSFQATDNPLSSTSPEIQEHQNIGIEPQQPQQNQLQLSQGLLMNFQTGLRVAAEDMHNQEHAFSLRQFPSTVYANNTENQMLLHSVVDPNILAAGGSVSPGFLSPATSGTNYFSESTAGHNAFMSSSQIFRQTPGSELYEIVSAATSASNSSTIGFDFPSGEAEYDPNFLFGSGFFS